VAIGAPRFFRDTLINQAAGAVPALLSLAALPFVLHRIGVESYGSWVAILATINGLSLFDLGLASSVTRAVAEAPVVAAERSEVREFVCTAFTVTLLIGAGIAVAILFVVPGVTTGLGLDTGTRSIIRVCAAIVALTGVITGFKTWVLTGLGRFDVASGVTALLSVSRTIACVASVAAGYGLDGVAVSYAACGVLAAVGAAIATTAVAPDYGGVRLTFASRALRRRASFSIASQSVQILGTLATDTIPVLVVGWSLGAAPVVVYYVGQRIAALASQITGAAGSVLYTAACEAGAAGGDLASLLAEGSRWMALLAIPLFVVVSTLAPNVLVAWLGAADPAAIEVLRLLVASMLVTALGEAGLYVLWVRSVHRVVAVSTVALGLSLATTLALTRAVGVSGAAAAVLVYSAASAVGFVWLGARACGTRLSTVAVRALSGMFVSAVAAWLVSVLFVRLLNPTSLLSVGSALVAGGATFALTFFAAGARADERRLVLSALKRLRR
jgi:O-antigen/teichoic acid export membrane protein